MFKNIYLKATLLSSILLFIACDKDDAPEAENEMEVFTKAVIKVTNLSDNSSETYEFEVEGHDDDHDHDHDHGVVVDNQEGEHGVQEIELSAGSEYKFEISFLNDSDPNNVIDMTEEVIEEADEHLVFYEFVGNVVSYESMSGDTIDSNGNALNLVTKWTTTTQGFAIVETYLIHQPTSKTGNTRDDFGGATDVEIEFEAHVE